jgi:hypothetical protein
MQKETGNRMQPHDDPEPVNGDDRSDAENGPTVPLV